MQINSSREEETYMWIDLFVTLRIMVLDMLELRRLAERWDIPV